VRQPSLAKREKAVTPYPKGEGGLLAASYGSASQQNSHYHSVRWGRFCWAGSTLPPANSNPRQPFGFRVSSSPLRQTPYFIFSASQAVCVASRNMRFGPSQSLERHWRKLTRLHAQAM
jgi:hypothetical protein